MRISSLSRTALLVLVVPSVLVAQSRTHHIKKGTIIGAVVGGALGVVTGALVQQPCLVVQSGSGRYCTTLEDRVNFIAIGAAVGVGGGGALGALTGAFWPVRRQSTAGAGAIKSPDFAVRDSTARRVEFSAPAGYVRRGNIALFTGG